MNDFIFYNLLYTARFFPNFFVLCKLRRGKRKDKKKVVDSDDDFDF